MRSTLGVTDVRTLKKAREVLARFEIRAPSSATLGEMVDAFQKKTSDAWVEYAWARDVSNNDRMVGAYGEYYQTLQGTLSHLRGLARAPENAAAESVDAPALVQTLHRTFRDDPSLKPLRTLLEGCFQDGSAIRVTDGHDWKEPGAPFENPHRGYLGLSREGFIWIDQRVVDRRGDSEVLKTTLRPVEPEDLQRAGVTLADVRDGIERLLSKLAAYRAGSGAAFHFDSYAEGGQFLSAAD